MKKQFANKTIEETDKGTRENATIFRAITFDVLMTHESAMTSLRRDDYLCQIRERNNDSKETHFRCTASCDTSATSATTGNV